MQSLPLPFGDTHFVFPSPCVHRDSPTTAAVITVRVSNIVFLRRLYMPRLQPIAVVLFALDPSYLAMGLPQTLSSIRFGRGPNRSSSAGSDRRFCARLRLSNAGVDAARPGDKAFSPLSSKRSFRRLPRPVKAEGGPNCRILFPSRLTSTSVWQRFNPPKLTMLLLWRGGRRDTKYKIQKCRLETTRDERVCL